MQLKQRIQAFHQLGEVLKSLPSDKIENWCALARAENPWFTPDNVVRSIKGITKFLDVETLLNWTAPYHLDKTQPKIVATVMAGNIPLVGFHDFLSVLISGHQLLMKLSSKDAQLFSQILTELNIIEPAFANYIKVAEAGPLRGFDAVIATGSDNSARYFDFYFNKYPNIIRKNRTSCAILTGKENIKEIEALGDDVFSYFGLGCRNVSKIFVPRGFSFITLLDRWEKFSDLQHHHKYHNNYDYQKAILLVNQQEHFDNGHLLISESDKLVSPISVLYYEYYNSEDELINTLLSNREKIQCIVGSEPFCTVSFGQTQEPGITDYADDINTLQFLSTL